MAAPDIANSTREERLAFIEEEFRCLGHCPSCGKCSFLKGKDALEMYKDYIEGTRTFQSITLEHRMNS